jgi:hypothetical protein
MPPQHDQDNYQRLWRSADAATLERRFFGRVNVSANGEILWATKKLLGRVANHREFLVTQNLSRDGARVLLRNNHHFPVGSRARLKLGIEFCEVEILGVQKTNDGQTVLRMAFCSPNARFNRVVEQYLPVANERETVETNWTGL